jgi:predicted adenylyl cyclase CyaB
MATNIEIKARARDLAAIERRARAIATGGPHDLVQDDTFFRCAEGRLKLREFPDRGAELIHYRRGDEAGAKASDYVIAPCADAAATREALSRALGVTGRVRKQRRLYLCGRTRIHLDRVEGLGDFVELEVVLQPGEADALGHAEAERLLAALGIEAAEQVRGAYLDLLSRSAPAA